MKTIAAKIRDGVTGPVRPRSIDAGLLLLRAGPGVSLFLIFGLLKLADARHFIQTGQPWPFVEFNRNLGLPMPTAVAYFETLNESLGAMLIATGFLSRLASGCLTFGLAAATYCSIEAHEPAWMLARFYCLIFTTLVLTGPGKFSIDYLLRRHAQDFSIYEK